jgi:hypothetical protein
VGQRCQRGSIRRWSASHFAIENWVWIRQHPLGVLTRGGGEGSSVDERSSGHVSRLSLLPSGMPSRFVSSYAQAVARPSEVDGRRQTMAAAEDKRAGHLRDQKRRASWRTTRITTTTSGGAARPGRRSPRRRPPRWGPRCFQARGTAGAQSTGTKRSPAVTSGASSRRSMARWHRLRSLTWKRSEAQSSRAHPPQLPRLGGRTGNHAMLGVCESFASHRRS